MSVPAGGDDCGQSRTELLGRASNGLGVTKPQPAPAEPGFVSTLMGWRLATETTTRLARQPTYSASSPQTARQVGE